MKSKSIWWTIMLLPMLALAAAGCSAAPPTPPSARVTTASEAVVTAKGSVVPIHYARLAFATGGVIAKIMVKEGDTVKPGDALAQLDTQELELQLKAAQDGLTVAQATLAQVKTPASAEEIAGAQAAYNSALAGLELAKKGPTAEDLAAAQAAYNSAWQALNRAQNGPTAADLVILKANLDKARVALDQAQAAYDRAGGASNPFAASLPTSRALQQATLDYQIAQADYTKATTNDPVVIAQAQATLAQALSVLQAKKGGAKAEDIAQAQAAVDQASAMLDLKKKGARPQDIQVAEAHVQQAQTLIEQAQAALNKATLTAPFEGTITNLAARASELVEAGAPVLTLADLSAFRVETSDLDEFGAAKVKMGQTAKITVNAFSDKTLTGKVSSIAQQSVTLSTGDISYVVTLALDRQDPDLRWGMTVKVEFQKE